MLCKYVNRQPFIFSNVTCFQKRRFNKTLLSDASKISHEARKKHQRVKEYYVDYCVLNLIACGNLSVYRLIYEQRVSYVYVMLFHRLHLFNWNSRLASSLNIQQMFSFVMTSNLRSPMIAFKIGGLLSDLLSKVFSSPTLDATAAASCW